MTVEFRISIATMPIRRFATVDEFAAQVREYAKASVEAGSGILLLPELSCLGLLWSDSGASDVAVDEVGAFYRRILTKLLPSYKQALAEIAHREGIWIAGASFWHERKTGAVNTAFAVGPDGNVEEQDKLHPTRPEQAIGTIGGDSLRLFDMYGVKVGILVCYDLQFPELSRVLMEQGVEVLLVPSLTTERGYWRIRYAAHARAIENQMFVCVSPLTGNLGIPQDHPVECRGGAHVTCPIDNRFRISDGLYAQSPMNEDRLLNVGLDLDTLRRSREKSEIRNIKDRRPDLYDRLQTR